MHIERLGVADVVAAPHTVDQRVARQHAAGVGEQHVQQLELLEWQRQRLTAHRNGVLLGIEGYLADDHRRRPQLSGDVAR